MTTPCTLFDLLSTQSALNLALLSIDRKPLNYGQLTTHLASAALTLNRLGIRSGQRVAVVLPNGPEMASAYLAVSAVCACAPLNPGYSLDEFTFYLSDLNASALIVPADSDSPARAAANQLGIPVIELAAHPEISGLFQLNAPLPSDESIPAPIFAGLDDIALILHTSGTTSRPKIVPISHRNIFHTAQNIVATYQLSPADRCLNMMPLFHIHGLMGALAATLTSGGSVICAPGLQPSAVLDWLSAPGLSWYTAVPTMHHAILEQARIQPGQAARVKLRFIRSSSAALPYPVAQGLEMAFNTPVLEAYGMTEATHQMASNPLPPHQRKPGSVGRATGTTQIAILDEIGNRLAANRAGEICIRGENVMRGYENNPNANESAFVRGWLRTGDLGIIDEDGYLFIQGRLKEIINRGGEKISPREIDDILMQHPAVAQAVTFALPHPTLGEDVAAAVVLRPEIELNARELRQFAKLHLAEFKVPRRVLFLDEIPKGPTGKVQRIGLADKLKGQLDSAPVETSTEIDELFERDMALEQKLAEIWRKILGLDVIQPDDDYFELGVDSLRATRLATQINEHFGTAWTAREILEHSTVRQLARFLASIAR